MRALLCCLLLLCVPLRSDANATSADAEAVTAGNLLASERWWPYQVMLLEAWKPAGSEETIAAHTRGVLIRVESAELARIDFGRSGLHDVPVSLTDLLESANQIRRGELSKRSPNFVTAIGVRIVDPAASPLRAVEIDEVTRQRGFLCVFADPESEGFAAMAEALAPLRGRAGVLTILFPQARGSDGLIAAKLRELGWPVPFVLDHLAEAYTGTLLPAKTLPPAVLLQTNEGRLLYTSPWQDGVAAKLAAAIDEEFGAR